MKQATDYLGVDRSPLSMGFGSVADEPAIQQQVWNDPFALGFGAQADPKAVIAQPFRHPFTGEGLGADRGSLPEVAANRARIVKILRRQSLKGLGGLGTPFYKQNWFKAVGTVALAAIPVVGPAAALAVGTVHATNAAKNANEEAQRKAEEFAAQLAATDPTRAADIANAIEADKSGGGAYPAKPMPLGQPVTDQGVPPCSAVKASGLNTWGIAGLGASLDFPTSPLPAYSSGSSFNFGAFLSNLSAAIGVGTNTYAAIVQAKAQADAVKQAAAAQQAAALAAAQAAAAQAGKQAAQASTGGGAGMSWIIPAAVVGGALLLSRK